jgi:hypothetical protein
MPAPGIAALLASLVRSRDPIEVDIDIQPDRGSNPNRNFYFAEDPQSLTSMADFISIGTPFSIAGLKRPGNVIDDLFIHVVAHSFNNLNAVDSSIRAEGSPKNHAWADVCL